MLLILRYDDPGAVDLAGLLESALRAFGRQPGFMWGAAARSPDDPRRWVVTARWDDAGSLRRGVGSFEAKIALGPLQAFEAPGSGVFEVLAELDADGYVRGASDRDPQADSAGPARPPGA